MALDINYDYLNILTTIVFIVLAPLLVLMGVFQAQGGENFARRSRKLDVVIIGLLLVFLFLIAVRIVIIAQTPS